MRAPTAFLAGLFACVPAQALNLNPDGYGQVLIFPYYTVNGGQSTLLSLQNRTRHGKALRVRFHEAQNGRDVLEFNLYLAPRDVWTASVYSLSEEGGAVLSTDDDSCTVPAIKHNALLPRTPSGRRYVALSNVAYTYSRNDAGSDSLSRTRSGHIEVIEMGVVTNGDGTNGRRTLDAISVGDDGMPRNCTQLINAWSPFAAASDAYWLQAPVGDTDLLAPTAANGGGHLIGSAGIVQFTDGTQLSYQADAIEGFSASLLHAFPDPGSKPQLSDANWPAPGGATAYWFEDGVLRNGRWPADRAIDAVSALFTHDVIDNEFVADSALASEWVITFPTKRFYVDPAKTPLAIAPFTQRFVASATREAGAEVGWHARQRDRNTWEPPESRCYDIDQFSPNCLGFGYGYPGLTEPQLDDEANVLRIVRRFGHSAGAILGAARASIVELEDGLSSGQMAMQLWHGDTPMTDGVLDQALSRPDLDGHRLVGVPVTGFWVERTTTTSVLANFAGTWRHRGTRCRVASGADPAQACPARLRR